MKEMDTGNLILVRLVVSQIVFLSWEIGGKELRWWKAEPTVSVNKDLSKTDHSSTTGWGLLS